MGDKNFRLSPDVRPTKYRFLVAPDIPSASFRASGTLELDVASPRHALTLHGVHLTVDKAHVTAGERRFAATVTPDADAGTLTFALDGELPAGKATLDVEYRGLLHKDLRGFYLAGGVAVTQFEAADARRVFPCCDEPPFKAVWELAVEAPADHAILSNAAPAKEEIVDGKRVVTFAPTAKLSSYLVALIVGKLVPSVEKVVRNVPVRTWSTPEKASLTSFAQECASSVLPRLEDYFGVPYAFGKVDQVGIPDFEAGAMENAGCITFREIALLIDPAKVPLSLQKRVAEVITHELAHMWFGNLVTMQWWDDLWLNEAFATWMAFKIVDGWRPGWRMWDDFQAGKAAALRLDGMESTHPIRADVKNAEQATENFDVITYEKGGAMLRMIEGYLGESAFRDGIRGYMKRHAWGNTVADDLWRALAEASGQPVDKMARAWIDQPGFPLVTVGRDGNKLVLSQRRFHASPAKFAEASTGAPWPVPVVLRWADDAGEHEARVLLEGAATTHVLDAKGEVKFVCANRLGTGFYRVKYDEPSMAALIAHKDALAPVERIELLADATALFQAGASSVAVLADLLTAFAADEDWAVLAEVVSGFDSLERRIVDDEHRHRLRAHVGRLFGPRLGALGWDAARGDSDDRRLLRAAVVRGLTLVARDADAVAEATRRLARLWAGEATALDPNLYDAASVAAARIGDATHFDALVERARTVADPAEKRRALVALASTETTGLVRRAVELILSDTVPMQDVTIYGGTLLANRATRDLGWELVSKRWSTLRQKLSPTLLGRTVEALRELSHRRAEVESFFVAEAASLEPVQQAVRQTRERLRLDEEQRRRGAPQLGAWLDARK